MTDLFDEPAMKDQVNGAFKREKIWFKYEKKDGEKKKLLSPTKEHAKDLMTALFGKSNGYNLVYTFRLQYLDLTESQILSTIPHLYA